ncbi:MAG: EamA family transporter [Rhodospirillales bacterium]|nr:EamA family transporter [Rhodospirillales bacterium]
MKPFDILTALLVMVIWGLNFVTAKLGVSELPPLLFSALRFALMAALLVPFYRPRWGQLPSLALLAFTLGVVHFGLFFIGIKGVDAATSAITVQLQVPFSALVAAWVFGDLLGWKRAGGMALAFFGVALLMGEPSRPDPFSVGLIVLSAVGFALSTLVIKKMGAMHPLLVTGWIGLLGAPMLLVLSLIFESDHRAAMESAGWRGWGGVVYAAVLSSIVGHSLWYRLLRSHTMNQVVPYSLLAPAIGVFSGVLLLDEPFTWHKLVGGLFTLSGVAIIQLVTARKAVA